MEDGCATVFFFVGIVGVGPMSQCTQDPREIGGTHTGAQELGQPDMGRKEEDNVL